MGPKKENWLREALEDYRLAQAELTGLKALKRDDLRFYVDEMTEILLDVKQAVIDVDAASAWLAMLELEVLRLEIRRFLKGERS